MTRQFSTSPKRSATRFHRAATAQARSGWPPHCPTSSPRTTYGDGDRRLLLGAPPPAPEPHRPKSVKRSFAWRLGMVALLGAVAALSLQGDLLQPWQPSGAVVAGGRSTTPPVSARPKPTAPAAPSRTVPPAPVRPAVLSAEQVYRKARSATVTVITPTSTGSGVFISRSGLLITNEHVVKQFPVVQIKTATGERIQARVLRVSKASDLAVLRITGMPALATCLAMESRPVRRGQTVYALGSPLQIEQVFTQGIVSGYSTTAILHTAATAPGNSGGPLMNEQGQIVGINTAVLRDYRSMSVSVPTAAIRRLESTASCGD